MRYRIACLATFILITFIILGGKLAVEQLVNGKQLSRAAVMMRSQSIALKEFPRGDILDRNGVPLTSAERGYALLLRTDLIPGYGKTAESREAALEKLQARLLPQLKADSQSEVIKNLKQLRSDPTYLCRLATYLDTEEVGSLLKQGLPELIIAPLIKRYREDGFMAHLLGYVGRGPENQGQSGLEKNYDKILAHPVAAPQLVSIVDAHNSAIPGLGFKVRQAEATLRSTVVLTIDKGIQQIVEKAMNNHVSKGAVVLMDIKSREVLALASRPTFNPYDDIAAIIANDPYSSLSNRALNRYHPGSLFKILLVAAALEEGVITPDETFYCEGEYVFNPEVSISCLKKEGHGQIDLITAFTHSCNPSFITIGSRLGRSSLLEYVDRFHLTDESLTGYIADYDYSYVDIEAGEPALGNACVGQKGVMLTPLELTSLIATIADQGLWKRPALVSYTVDHEGQRTTCLSLPKEKVLSSKTATMVAQLMEQVVASGSGQSAAVPGVRIAGKTATSQTGGLDTSTDPPREILNVWFGGYFPAENPRFALLVLVEDGQSGSQDAAPVFKEIVSGILGLYSLAG